MAQGNSQADPAAIINTDKVSELLWNRPNKKLHKMYRQFAKPPGQPAGEYSKDYPRVSSVEGDEKIYAQLESPTGTACSRRMIL